MIVHGDRPHRGKCSPEYQSWGHMIQRCTNSNDPAYRYYGRRGIEVCAEWRFYPNFVRDMGRRPTRKHTLDRIDNEGNYEPGNCKWSTRKEQANNRKHGNRYVQHYAEVK